MHWIDPNTQLPGNEVILYPLEEQHLEIMEELANEQQIWEYSPFNMSTPARRKKIFENALVEKEQGTQVPYIIFHREHKKIVGSTRLMSIEPVHKKLEIGWTWLHPKYWKTRVNLEAKLLLLTHCFEVLNATRVMLRTDEKNIRSQKAIEKIGGIYEGLIRHDLIREDGSYRNSAYFSLINTEWVEAKKNLIQLIENKKI
jgi:RimJ/RimL family protein N-acetyltransferase